MKKFLAAMAGFLTISAFAESGSPPVTGEAQLSPEQFLLKTTAGRLTPQSGTLCAAQRARFQQQRSRETEKIPKQMLPAFSVRNHSGLA